MTGKTISSKGKAQKKKLKKQLSFAFTHTYTLEKLTLLLFAPKRTSKILKNVQNAAGVKIPTHAIVYGFPI